MASTQTHRLNDAVQLGAVPVNHQTLTESQEELAIGHQEHATHHVRAHGDEAIAQIADDYASRGDGVGLTEAETPTRSLSITSRDRYAMMSTSQSAIEDLDDMSDSSSDEEGLDDAQLLASVGDDELTSQLAAAGPIGVAAAAAVATGRKRKRPSGFLFETNPSVRKRQSTRLLRKLKSTIDEYYARIGQHAAVVLCQPSKSAPSQQLKVVGSPAMEESLNKHRDVIMSQLSAALQQQTPTPQRHDESLHSLPALVCDGIPTPLDKMTQAQLRAFIPEMLKYATGRPKPGWGKEDLKPPWWPEGLPWQNVRSDARSEEEKRRTPWTEALRQIVKNCYTHFGRQDLFPEMNDGTDEPAAKRQYVGQTAVIMQDHHGLPGLTAQQLQQLPPNTQLIQQINPDGTISYLAVDLSDPNTAAIVAQAHAQAAQVLQGEAAQGVAALAEVAASHILDGAGAAPIGDTASYIENGQSQSAHVETEGAVLVSSIPTTEIVTVTEIKEDGEAEYDVGQEGMVHVSQSEVTLESS
ncbi:DNA-binding protein P3A2-like [Corticium candelabrum]|uniref:DNA-binding protein P3A2-like n=1 Tax=Corticium candelabrum TaxID=121492 RepID=UPI002E261792|nr:DNA-binding protein P3A2-like [Corticium candelabrum]